MMAGGLSGWVASNIYCPIEYAKIQKQLSGEMKQSSLGLLMREFYHNGVKNIYKGYWATAFRELTGASIYYLVYESIMRGLFGRNREKAGNWAFIGGGATAGICYTLVTYPTDTIKSNIQMGMKFKEAVGNGLRM